MNEVNFIDMSSAPYANGAIVAWWWDGVFTKGKVVGNNDGKYYHVQPFIPSTNAKSAHYSDNSYLIPAENIWFFKKEI